MQNLVLEHYDGKSALGDIRELNRQLRHIGYADDIGLGTQLRNSGYIMTEIKQ